MYKYNEVLDHGDFVAYVESPEMPCVFGKKVVEKGNYTYLVVEDTMSDPRAAIQVCEGLYSFIQEYGIAQIGQGARLAPKEFASFDVAFVNTRFDSQAEACVGLYSLLINMHRYDKDKGYPWAEGVSNDPNNPNFQMSIGGQAWFLPLLWPGAYAPARRAPHVYLAWQSNNLFEALKKANKYEAAQDLVRAKEVEIHGSVPKLLGQLGQNLEILSYLLPPEEEAQLVWDTLLTLGGDHPFGVREEME